MPVTEHPRGGPFSGALSTSLLDDIWANALDPGYREATEARAAGRGAPRGTARRAAAVVLTALLVGSAVAAGAAEVRRSVVAGRGTKAQLITQIRAAERTGTSLTAAETAAHDQLAADRARSLASTASGDQAAADLATVEAASAETAVVGPGVTVRLTDGPPAGGAAPGAADPARVTDVDIRQVVNALWAAGAEAVSVNGLRLGPRTAVRTAGSAVLVDFRPVESPYVVAAIGPTNALETGYAASAAAARLSTLSGAYGIDVAVGASRALHLPASSGPDPVRATPVGNGS